MATNTRTFPNSYYTWYNDDDRLAILVQDVTSTSGERTTEKYDTFQGSGSSGVITAFTDDVSNTVATCEDHGISINDSVTIADTTNFNATYTVTARTKDTFTFVDGDTPEGGETGTWSATSVLGGIRLTFHSKYEEVTAITDDLKTAAGLNSALHTALLCYVKARLFEDAGNFQEAQYFRQMYDVKVKKHRGRRSGIRHLSVPRL